MGEEVDKNNWALGYMQFSDYNQDRQRVVSKAI